MNPHILLLPILIPLGGAMGALLLGRRPNVQGGLALTAMVAGLLSSLAMLEQVWAGSQALTLQLGGWAAPVGITLVALVGIYAGFMLSRLLGIRVAKAVGGYKE